MVTGSKLIQVLIDKTIAELLKIEKALYLAILNHYIDQFDIQDNKIVFTSQNILVVQRITQIQKLQKKIQGLVTTILKGIDSIIDDNENDFRFDVRAIEVSKAVRAKIRKHATATVGQNTDLELVYADIKKTSIALMSKYGGVSLRELRKALEEKIVDKKILNRYWSRWTHDIYQQYQRVGANEVRKELGLTNAIYEGGTIEDTRDWCEKHNGKALSEEEIEDWVNHEWKGKNEIGYDPIVDCGGYNCRHRWRWISDELAENLREKQA